MPRYTVKQLLRMPWTFQGPTRVDVDPPHYELRVVELPDFFLAGETHEEVLNDLRPALETFLASYVEHGEDPPIPADLERWRMVLRRQLKPVARKKVTLRISGGEGSENRAGGAVLATADS